MRRIRCMIDGCNSYIEYKHLGLCKKHYTHLNCTLGWKNPSTYMDDESAKRVVENDFTYSQSKAEHEWKGE